MRDIEDYTKKYICSDFERYQVAYRQKKMIEIIEKHPHKSILEIGCGMEPLFQYVNQYENYTIVEPSYVFCDNAMKMAEDKKNVEIIQGYIETTVDKLEKKFDYIICSSLLHEVENPDNLLNAISIICSEQTILHINVPNANSLHRLLALEMGLIENQYTLSERALYLQQQNVYNIKQLETITENHGFQIIESGSYFIKPFTHVQMMKMLDDNIISEAVLDGLYQLIKYMPEYGSEIYVNAKK